SVYAVTFEVTDLEPRFVQTIETKTVKDEQIFWFDNIEVDAKGIIAALDAEFGELKPYSPISKNLLKKAFQKMVSKDKNDEIKITYKNLEFYLTIARGEFETNKLGMFQVGHP
ncbi:hypothetical protein, partial [Clostridium tarantellae]|uniref:hypothetical protein n=1 Tax=Clostridium tarantellae TaxID=39493 RepID=UPI001478D76E